MSFKYKGKKYELHPMYNENVLKVLMWVSNIISEINVLWRVVWTCNQNVNYTIDILEE